MIQKQIQKCSRQNGDHSLAPALCWTGGKTRLKNRLVQNIPEHKVYIEPFIGGGSIFWKKPLVEKNVINDKNSELIWFYRNLRDTNCAKLQHCNLPTNASEFKGAVGNRKKSVCAFLGVNKRSYACQMDKPRFNLSKSQGKNPKKAGIENLNKSCNKYQEKLRKTKILNEDFKSVVQKHDSKDAFIYMDPPYVDTYAYGQEAVSPEEVCKLAKRVKGKVMLSYNDHPRVRKACKGLRMKQIETNYEIQKAITGKGKTVKELIITNY